MDESATKVILIAGGIGITPISTMARRAKSLGMDYALHYSGRNRANMALLDELAALPGQPTRCGLSSSSPRWARWTRRKSMPLKLS